MKRLSVLAITIIVYAILLGGSAVFWVGVNCFTPTDILGNCPWFPSKNAPEKIPDFEDAITLLFAGDIMLDRGVEFYITKHNDWKWPFLLIADTLQKADLVFGNLESIISNKGEDLGSIYSFRADPKALEGLTFAGFGILSVANNHSFDYGIEAFVDSVGRLSQASIATVGGGMTKDQAHAPAVKEVRGTRIGFLGYTNLGSPLWQAGEETAGVAWVDETTLPELQENIRKVKQNADILVVSLHFGEEYQKEPSETQKLIAQNAINAGADVVVGHHPHVVQPVEQYNDGWIAYSLGNFVFDQGFSPETMEGILLEVVVQDKKIMRVTPRSIYLNTEFQPNLQNLAQ